MGSSGPHGGSVDGPVVSPVDGARLSHVDADGAAQMVDVSGKESTVREAVASGTFYTTAEVLALISSEGLPKGDAISTARIAAIMAAKRTSELVPLCHPIALSGITVDFVLAECSIEVTVTVRTCDRTGVEMEALTAVAVAGLTLHDMVKAVDPAARMDGVQVVRKIGGKTGLWQREQ